MKRRQKLLLSVLIIVCMIMISCQRKEDGRSKETYSLYNISVFDLGITPKYYPSDEFRLSDDYCYFYETTKGKEEKEYLEVQNDNKNVYTFYRVALTLDAEIEQLFAIDGVRMLSYQIEKVNGCIALSIIVVENDQCVYLKYDLNGNQLERTILHGDGLIYSGIFKHWNNGNDCLITLENDLIRLFDLDGESFGEICCSGEGFRDGVLGIDGAFYVTYHNANATQNQVSLATVDVRECRLKEEFEIPGNGKNLDMTSDNLLYTLDASAIWSIDPKEKKTITAAKLDTSYGITINRIWALNTEGDDYRLLSWNSQMMGKPVELITLSETSHVAENTDASAKTEKVYSDQQELDANGRMIISLYDPYGYSNYIGIEQIINDFNSENREYSVVIEKSTEQSFEGELNKRLASGKVPDLMLIPDSEMIKSMYKKGYLEDLLPYIEKSTVLMSDDIDEVVFRLFGFNEGLFAIPRRLAFFTIMVPSAKEKNNGGWTIEEMLDWADQHSEIPFYEDPKTSMLSFGLLGNWRQWVDLENKKAYFDQENFQLFLNAIKGWKCQNPVKYETYGITNQGFESLNSYYDLSSAINQKMIWRGFPNENRQPQAMLRVNSSFCILADSANKEGAFKFLEYLFEYPHIEMQGHPTGSGELAYPLLNGYFWSLKSLQKEELELMIQLEEDCEEDSDGPVPDENRASKMREDMGALLSILHNANVYTEDDWTIWRIVVEEAQGYLDGDRDLETTCDVIQSRVQLFLNEG